MKTSNHFSIKHRVRSFSYAFKGILMLFKKEHNARIHVAAAIGVVGLGVYMKINTVEWFFIVFAIGLVFLAELLNTAIERLADKVEPQWDELIGEAKDYAAGAVLVAAIVSVITGALIFIPKILNLLS